MGNTAAASLLYETRRVDANWRDNNGRTPLVYAVSEGRIEIANVLIKIGKVDVDSRDNPGRTRLSWATKRRWDKTVKLLETQS